MYYIYAYRPENPDVRIAHDFKTLAAAIEWVTSGPPGIAYTAIVFLPFN